MDIQVIQNQIFEVRGTRVMIDYHLAKLYNVETRVLKQAVNRNIERFPADFMYVLTEKEAKELLIMGVSQNVIPPGYNFGVSLPFAFTELGVAMLSSVLRSQTAINVNISIMRAFVLCRQSITQYNELYSLIEQLTEETENKFDEVYNALLKLAKLPQELKKLDERTDRKIEQLIELLNPSQPMQERKRIGFIRDEEK